VNFLQDLPKGEQKLQIKNSWILVHDDVVKRLQRNDGFKLKKGMGNFQILYRYKENVLEEIILDYVPFRNWFAIFAIRHLGTGKEEYLYCDADKVTEPEYFVRLNLEA